MCCEKNEMLWIETTTADEARELHERMWGITAHEGDRGTAFCVRGEGLREGDEFWADAIGKLKDDPDKRLDMALSHLPLPGAFREAGVALRGKIRAARKNGRDCEPLLRELYFLAAIWSFYIPYAARLGQPGYNVMARIPFSAFRTMDLAWSVLGYEKFDLLNRTDCGLMVAAWGEPAAHMTAHELYHSIWDSYEQDLIAECR